MIHSTEVVIFGRGSYVLGNGNTPPTILSAVLTSLRFLGANNPRIILLGKNADVSIDQKERVSELVKKYWGDSSISICYDACDKFHSYCLDGVSFSQVAIVSIPDHLHFAYLHELVSLAIPTICVKPIVTSLKNYNFLISRVDEVQVPLFVDFHKRLDPSFQYLKYLISHDPPGYIESVDVFYSQPVYDLLTQTSHTLSTNVFQYLGVHFIDIISWLFNSRLSSIDFRVYPQLDSSLPPVNPRIDASSVWSMPDSSEFFASVSCRWSALTSTPIRSEQYFRVKTDKMDIFLNLSDRGIHVLGNDGYTIPNPYFSSAVQSFLNPLLSDLSGYGHSIYYHFLAGALATDPCKRNQHYSHLPTLQSVRDSVIACEAFNISQTSNKGAIQE